MGRGGGFGGGGGGGRGGKKKRSWDDDAGLFMRLLDNFIPDFDEWGIDKKTYAPPAQWVSALPVRAARALTHCAGGACDRVQANITYESAQAQRKCVELRHHPRARQPLSDLLLRRLRDVHTGGWVAVPRTTAFCMVGFASAGGVALAVVLPLNSRLRCRPRAAATALHTCVHQHGHNQDLVDNTGCLCPCIMACIPVVHCCELTRARRNMRVRMGIKVQTLPATADMPACSAPRACFPHAVILRSRHTAAIVSGIVLLSAL